MLIVICGPIASGRSTLARAVARRFERQGSQAAAVDLDLVYEMVDPSGAAKDSLPMWRRARRAAAALTDALLRDGTGVVVLEGEFLTAEQRAELVGALRSPITPLFVTVHVPVEVALQRVQADPLRGRSRDPVFLRCHYEQLEETVSNRPATDLVIDTSSVGVDETARTISEWAASGRLCSESWCGRAGARTSGLRPSC